ncbi:prokaryotic cytochrome C oxidase subunit IV family protein [Mycobacterium sp. IS-1742]|uniref:cytochrome C oxidase subunit IV family protein n=1 Tax=Mycobacterium sp. IS-1742 TaxID=1772285 RepID=UPI00073FBF97|nr:cytochrome C oxidase subunit IV family protein [Mycobacterium sp. IS-1742]KUI27133.1 prokaryotic cytochrome C oxidase subunit IV family protein [Mycobacterium sp. IS-1742]
MTAVTAETSNRSMRTTTYVWLALSAITIVSWWLAPGHSEGRATASAPVTVAVVILGFVKGRMIIRNFMEVGTAPRWLRLATDAWLALLWVAVLVIYWL